MPSPPSCLPCYPADLPPEMIELEADLLAPLLDDDDDCEDEESEQSFAGPHPPPNRVQIRMRAMEIQRGWSEREKLKRANFNVTEVREEHWMPPSVSVDGEYRRAGRGRIDDVGDGR